MKKILLILAITLIGVTACQDKNKGKGNSTGAPDAFIAMSNEGIFYNGIILFEKDEDTHQISENPIRMIYRIQNDDQTVYVNFSLQSKVTQVGQATSINAKSVGINYFASDSYDVVLSQIKDGKAWYWCKDKNIGFLIPSF